MRQLVLPVPSLHKVLKALPPVRISQNLPLLADRIAPPGSIPRPGYIRTEAAVITIAQLNLSARQMRQNSPNFHENTAPGTGAANRLSGAGAGAASQASDTGVGAAGHVSGAEPEVTSRTRKAPET